MSIGSVSVDVVPDASGFVEKLKAKLSDIKDVKVGVNLDTGKARAELDKLATTRRSVTINAKADTGAARAELDRLAKTRTTTVRAKVDKSSFSSAESAASGAAGGMGALATAAISLGPALVPVTAAVAGLTGALAAGVAGAGGGLAIFGGLTVAALAKAKTDLKQIQTLNKQAATATDPKKAAALRKQANDMLTALPEAEQAFLKTEGTIGKGFDRLLKKSGAGLFTPLTKGSALIAKVLPKLSPIVDAFGGAISRTIDKVSHWTDTGSFKGLIDYLAGPGVRSFDSLLTISKNVAVGVGGMLKAFTPMGTSVLGSIDKATTRFARFGQALTSNKGFQSFMAYVRRVGPLVGRTLGDIGSAALNAAKALAPQGGVILNLADGLAKLVANAKPGQLAAIAGGIGAIGLATGKIGKIAGLSLIVTSLSYADKHSKVFHTLAEGAGALASALNKLPSGVKIAGALALGAGALKLRGGLGGGGIGGAVSRVVGGGVQKVFVVNMGAAGLGGGKAGGGTVVGAGGAGIGNKALGAATTLAVGTMVVGNTKSFSGRAVGGAATGAIAGGQLAGPVGAVVGGIGGGVLGALTSKDNSNFRFADAASSKNIAKMAASYRELKAERDRLTKGASPEQLRRLLDVPGPVREDTDKMAVLLRKMSTATGESAKKIRGLVLGYQTAGHSTHSAALNFEEFRFAAQKAGIGSGQLGKMLRSLPPTVRTKIATPGSLQSHAQIKALQKQYGLTPKQIRTVTKLVGARDAQNETKKTRNGLRILNTTSAKPHIGVVGAPRARGETASTRHGLLVLNTTSAKPHIAVTGAGAARAAANSVRAAMASIHSSTATITINRVTNQIVNHRNTYDGNTGHATGGYITGPGSGTSDSIPARLSNGEFVITAAATARHRALLEAINSNRFASGGPVSTSAPASVPMSFGGGVQRIVLDTGGGTVLTGVIDNRIGGHAALAATQARASR